MTAPTSCRVCAKTGPTSCRTPERARARWPEGVIAGQWTAADEPVWIERLFRDLVNGLESVARALRLAHTIETEYGFVRVVDEHRLTLHTADRNPAIMTGRAAGPQIASSTFAVAAGDTPSWLRAKFLGCGVGLSVRPWRAARRAWAWTVERRGLTADVRQLIQVAWSGGCRSAVCRALAGPKWSAG